MGSFAYKLEYEDGTPAEPPSFKTSVPTWRADDVIPLGQGRSLRVIETRRDGDGIPVLVVRNE